MATLKTSERVAERLREIVKSMGGGSVQIGWREDAEYEDGTPVAAAMWWLEVGHQGHFPAPPRPFFKPMISEKSPEWPAEMAAWAKISNYNGPQVLGQMGAVIAGQLQDALINLTEPPLSPTTLALRAKFGNHPEEITIKDVLQAQHDVASGTAGTTTATQGKPGVWTGKALRSVTFRVMK